MVEYTIDDIRGPTVAREMAQLKEFVLAKFNGAIADAEAAAAAAATAAANAVLANTVKKTGEASQVVAGNLGVTGTLDAAAVGSGSTPITCGDLTAYGNVSLDDTTLQGNLSAADANALINLSGVGSVLVPTPTGNSEAATKKYVDDADALKLNITDVNNYAVGLTGNQTAIAGNKTFTGMVTLSVTRIAPTGGSGFNILYKFKNTHTQTLLMTGGRTVIIAQVNRAGGYKKVLATSSRDYTTPSWLWVVQDGDTGDYYLVAKGLYSATMNVHFINSFQYGSVYPMLDDLEPVDQSTTDPTTDSRWSSVIEVGNYD